MKVQAGGLKLYQKRDSDTGAVEFSRTMFLLENFLEFWMYFSILRVSFYSETGL